MARNDKYQEAFDDIDEVGFDSWGEDYPEDEDEDEEEVIVEDEKDSLDDLFKKEREKEISDWECYKFTAPYNPNELFDPDKFKQMFDEGTPEAQMEAIRYAMPFAKKGYSESKCKDISQEARDLNWEAQRCIIRMVKEYKNNANREVTEYARVALMLFIRNYFKEFFIRFYKGENFASMTNAEKYDRIGECVGFGVTKMMEQLKNYDIDRGVKLTTWYNELYLKNIAFSIEADERGRTNNSIFFIDNKISKAEINLAQKGMEITVENVKRELETSIKNGEKIKIDHILASMDRIKAENSMMSLSAETDSTTNTNIVDTKKQKVFDEPEVAYIKQEQSESMVDALMQLTPFERECFLAKNGIELTESKSITNSTTASLSTVAKKYGVKYNDAVHACDQALIKVRKLMEVNVKKHKFLDNKTVTFSDDTETKKVIEIIDNIIDINI